LGVVLVGSGKEVFSHFSEHKPKSEKLRLSDSAAVYDLFALGELVFPL
jgi:hypothetical protein